MTSIPPPDQKERQQAIDPRISVHVEAPAGSGKTAVLLKRYLRLLAQVQEPEDILALTFTRKAAGELRARVQKELLGRTDSDDNLKPHQAELRELALAASRHQVDKGVSFLERLHISTFHSFCAQLLRQAPHEAGLPPDFGLLEDREGTRLQQEAVELMRRRLAGLPPGHETRQALVRRLVRMNNNWPWLAAELQGLLARRDILGDFISLARECRDPAAYEAILVDHLGKFLLPALADLAEEFRLAEIGRAWPDLHRYLRESGADLAGTLPEAIPGAGLTDLAGWRAVAEGLLSSQGGCYRRLSPPKFPQGMAATPFGSLLLELPGRLVQQLNEFRDLPAILLQPDEVPAVQDLIILLHQTLAAYEELCASRRAVDFIALEQAALKLLAGDDRGEMLSRVYRRLTHLLVDEFQDTSVNQIDLLCRLLNTWQGDPNRSLMVVGDPKQSIYGWRQARLELFYRSRQGLPCPGAPPVQHLTLSTNFRSSQKLILWANAVFGKTIMQNRRESGVDFRRTEAAPEAALGDDPGLFLFNDPDRSRARELEAAWLARELAAFTQKQQARDPQDRETAGVLLFVRRHLPTYLKACRQAGLSLRVRDGLPLLESLAVQQGHTAAAALVQPHDDVAWAALLRSFAGPQPLSLMAEVAVRDGDFWREKIAGFAAAPHCPPRVREVYRAAAAAQERIGREPLHDILGDWLIQVGAWQQAAAAEGPQGVANLKAYLNLLAAASSGTPEATLSQVQDLLAQAYQPPDPRAEDSPVEVLTVHGAKGLEYDYVYLPHLDWEPLRSARNEAPFLLEEAPDAGTAVIALNRPYAQKDQSVLYRTLKNAANHRSLAEARRLFYVAVTRARKRLALSAVVKRNKDGEFQFSGNSPLGWLRRHYPKADLFPGVVHLWPEPPLRVSLLQEVSEGAAPPESPKPMPPPYELHPEPRPYELRFPSQLAVKPGVATPGRPAALTDPTARLRGDITHRLLETLSRGKPLPEAETVAPALLPAAPSPAAALDLAREILAEVRACQDDPFLAPLLDPDLPLARSEWLLEAWPAAGTVYRGQIDRLVFDGRQWWLLDYKTSRPAPNIPWEEFLSQEVEQYRPQLLAYREMAARFFNLTPPERINTVLYFTASRRHVFL